jgi:hypothetical protein
MRTPVSFLRRLLSRDRPPSTLLQVLTPEAAASTGRVGRLVLAGFTLVLLGGAALTALGAFVTLMLALGAIYFLATQVLGIQLDIDPRTFVERAEQYARGAYSN